MDVVLLLRVCVWLSLALKSFVVLFEVCFFCLLRQSSALFLDLME